MPFLVLREYVIEPNNCQPWCWLCLGFRFPSSESTWSNPTAPKPDADCVSDDISRPQFVRDRAHQLPNPMLTLSRIPFPVLSSYVIEPNSCQTRCWLCLGYRFPPSESTPSSLKAANPDVDPSVTLSSYVLYSHRCQTHTYFVSVFTLLQQVCDIYILILNPDLTTHQDVCHFLCILHRHIFRYLATMLWPFLLSLVCRWSDWVGALLVDQLTTLVSFQLVCDFVTFTSYWLAY